MCSETPKIWRKCLQHSRNMCSEATAETREPRERLGAERNGPPPLRGGVPTDPVRPDASSDVPHK